MESEVISFPQLDSKLVLSLLTHLSKSVDYAGSFGDAAKGKTIVAAQHAAGADVIYQAAGGTGAGVFSEAKSLNESKMKAKSLGYRCWPWPKAEEGEYTSKDGKESNFVLFLLWNKSERIVQRYRKQGWKGEFLVVKWSFTHWKMVGWFDSNNNLPEAKKAVEDAKS